MQFIIFNYIFLVQYNIYLLFTPSTPTLLVLSISTNNRKTDKITWNINQKDDQNLTRIDKHE